MTDPAELRVILHRAAASARWAGYAHAMLLLTLLADEAMFPFSAKVSAGRSLMSLAMFAAPSIAMIVFSLLIRAGQRLAADLASVLAIASVVFSLPFAVTVNSAYHANGTFGLWYLVLVNASGLAVVCACVRLAGRAVRASRALPRPAVGPDLEPRGFEPIMTGTSTAPAAPPMADVAKEPTQ